MSKRSKTLGAGFYPDSLGLDEINVLLAEVAADLRVAPVATSALLDGSALKRRQRREGNRAMGAVVRVLPVRAAVVSFEDAA